MPLGCGADVDELADLVKRIPGYEFFDFVHRGEIFGLKGPFVVLLTRAMDVPDAFDGEASLSSVSEPSVDATIEEADLADPGIDQAPAKARGGHDAIGVASVDDDLRGGGDPEAFQSLLKLGCGHDIGLVGMIVEGVVIAAIYPGLEIRWVDLDRSGEMLEDRHLGVKRVIDGGEVGFENDGGFGKLFLGQTLDESLRMDEGEGIIGGFHRSRSVIAPGSFLTSL